MRIFQLIFVFLAAGLVFSACTTQPSVPAADTTPSQIEETQELTETTVKTGRVEQIGDSFYLTQPSGEKIALDSYSVRLSDYVNATHTVTGQYSGDTLSVGSIK